MDDLSYIQAPPRLDGILARTAELGFGMASEPRTGALLRALAASKPGGRMLELGTGTGVGTTWLLAGMDAESTLVSVDIDANVQLVAREALGGDPRLTFVTEHAASFLRGLPAASFDLVFADSLSGKFEALDEALAVIRPGGYYVIDDLLPQPSWPEGHAPRIPALMARLVADRQLHLAPMTWASGIVIVVKKSTVAPFPTDL